VLRPANSTANLARATRMPAADAKRSAEPATKDAASTYFIAGGVAGIVSRTCIAPIERVKILYQINRGSSQAWYRIPGQILHNEGVLAFWKGNTAAVVRVMPYMSLTFMSYEEYKVRCLQLGAAKQAAALGAGSAAGVTAVVLTYPLDLVRARMAMPESPHTSMFGALRTIATERGVGALYHGVGATCLGVAPYAGLKFMSYEGLKTALGAFFGISEEQLRPWQRMGSGLVAGLVAQTAVYPLDVVRRRMQTQGAAAPLYRSTFHALTTIGREEGLRAGLYRGLTINYLKTMPNVAIYMTLYDIVKLKLLGSSKAAETSVGARRSTGL
jgi:solute carrier family 25 protein 42